MKSLLRSLYYRVPVELRLPARRAYYLPLDLLKPLPGLSPPRGLIYTGGDGTAFIEQGNDIIAFLAEYSGLAPDSEVLDIGSGIGRVAIPLSHVLHAPGSYDGFDVVERGVAWCTKHIGRRHTNFNFLHVDLANDLYRGTGARAEEFTFPYPDRAFTLAIATSVFTHMLPGAVQRYLSEVARVLRPGGTFTFTAFVLDGESRRTMGSLGGFTFPFGYGEYALFDEGVAAANVGYERTFLEGQVLEAGFEITTYVRGSWSDRVREHPAAFQDIYVVTRR